MKVGPVVKGRRGLVESGGRPGATPLRCLKTESSIRARRLNQIAGRQREAMTAIERAPTDVELEEMG